MYSGSIISSSDLYNSLTDSIIVSSNIVSIWPSLFNNDELIQSSFVISWLTSYFQNIIGKFIDKGVLVLILI